MFLCLQNIRVIISGKAVPVKDGKAEFVAAWMHGLNAAALGTKTQARHGSACSL